LPVIDAHRGAVGGNKEAANHNGRWISIVNIQEFFAGPVVNRDFASIIASFLVGIMAGDQVKFVSGNSHGQVALIVKNIGI